MHRIVFMGTPDFAVPILKALVETQEVVGVVTQPDRPAGRGQQLRPSPIKQLALAADLPLFQPGSLKREPAAAPLREWAPEAIVVAAFGQILRPHVLALPPHGCINVHASLLPRWRGASPIHHAILAGDAQTGISLMRMDAGMDTGPVYIKEAVSILPSDTAASLHDRLAALGAVMVHEHLEDILAGRLTPEPQNEADATYAPLIKKEDGWLDWTASAEQLARRVRAMTPWPGAATTWQGRQLKILRANVAPAPNPTAPPGTVFADDGGAIVQTGVGGLSLLRVQLAGRNASPIAAFLRGSPELIGSRLSRDDGP